MEKIVSKWKTLKFRRLWDSKMRELGFQDIADSKWLYFRNNQKEALSFIIIMNKNDYTNNKIKLVDRETKRVVSVKDIENTPYKNNTDVLLFLKDIYVDFYIHGLIIPELVNKE